MRSCIIREHVGKRAPPEHAVHHLRRYR
jgi:hypothetical protein